jgi:serine/threonine-protein kinase
MIEPRLETGSLFGKFRIVRRVDRGLGWESYEAARGDPPAEMRVLLKVERNDPPEHLDCLAVERRVSTLIEHPNLLHGIEAGEVDGRSYLALELVEGPTYAQVLAKLRERGATPPTGLAAWIAHRTLLALAALHDAQDDKGGSLGIVHGAVSPAALVLTAKGALKLGNLGGAAIAGCGDARPRMLAVALFPYLAPEQRLGGTIDLRADLFSVALMLYESIAGHAAGGKRKVQLVGLLLEGKLPTLEERSLVGREVSELVMRGLARDPAARFASARDFATALFGAMASRWGQDPERQLARLVAESEPPDARIEPPRIQTQRSDPRIVPPRVEPARLEPRRSEPRIASLPIEPRRSEPPRVESRAAPRVEPPRIEPQRIEPRLEPRRDTAPRPVDGPPRSEPRIDPPSNETAPRRAAGPSRIDVPHLDLPLIEPSIEPRPTDPRPAAEPSRVEVPHIDLPLIEPSIEPRPADPRPAAEPSRVEVPHLDLPLIEPRPVVGAEPAEPEPAPPVRVPHLTVSRPEARPVVERDDSEPASPAGRPPQPQPRSIDPSLVRSAVAELDLAQLSQPEGAWVSRPTQALSLELIASGAPLDETALDAAPPDLAAPASAAAADLAAPSPAAAPADPATSSAAGASGDDVSPSALPPEESFLPEETRIGIGAPIDRERLRRLAEAAAARSREEDEPVRDTIPDGPAGEEMLRMAREASARHSKVERVDAGGEAHDGGEAEGVLGTDLPPGGERRR